MKKFLCTAIFVVMSLTLSAQISKFAKRMEIVELEINDGEERYEIFNYPGDSLNTYYLSVGHLGIGDDFIQFQIDPAFELFLPIGATLSESMETLKGLQELFKKEPGTSIEMQGCLALGVPVDELEPVTITFRKALLKRSLEFTVRRENYIRSTLVSKSDLGSLVTSLKFYRKFHPKEQ